jgi:hypothetical protein
MGGPGDSDRRGDADHQGWISWIKWILDVVPRWAQAIVAVLALLGVGAAIKGTSGTSTPSSSTPSSSQSTHPAATAAYLKDLQPQGGDTPMQGDAQIGDQDFPHSIFYDNIPDNQSNASTCQSVGDPTCRSTDYSIATGYHHFSAMLGVTGCDGDGAHWSLKVGSDVVRSGTVAVNSSPQRIAVAIPRGDSLELLTSTSSFSGAACGDVNIIWGNARLS